MSLGFRQLYLWAGFALFAVWALSAAAPARASHLALADAICVTGADSAEAAFAVPADQLRCRTGRFSQRDRFLRARVKVDRPGLVPAGPLIWQTDPTSFDSMLIRLDFADGSQRVIDVDAQMAARNWDANGNFWVPVKQTRSPLTAMDVVVERPQSGAVFARMTLSSYAEAARAHYSRTLLYVFICGALLIPIVYDLLFYRVLRVRFIVWHLGMTFGTLLYVLFNSGLILLAVPDMPNLFRYGMIFVAMSLTIACMARFAMLLLDEGAVAPRVRRALAWSVAINLGISVLILFDLEILRIRVVDAYYVSVLPVIGSFLWAMTTAVRQRSRAAISLMLAFLAPILAGLTQVLGSLGLFEAAAFVDEAVYCALVLLIIGTSAGVADRFLAIKAERDRARLTAHKLGTMANSDGLTGLLNRRAFDQTRRLASGRALLLADIDRFKSINDTFGHQRGDAVLCHAAKVIEEVVLRHGGGEVYRLGGEEFAVLMPPADAAEMRQLAEAIRAAVEESADRDSGYDMPEITISLGAVMGEGQLMHVAYAEADGALYRAKDRGRNRCEFARPD